MCKTKAEPLKENSESRGPAFAALPRPWCAQPAPPPCTVPSREPPISSQRDPLRLLPCRVLALRVYKDVWPSPQLCLAVTGAALVPTLTLLGRQPATGSPSSWVREGRAGLCTVEASSQNQEMRQGRTDPRPAATVGSREPPSPCMGSWALAHETGHSGRGQTDSTDAGISLFRGVCNGLTTTHPT